MNRSNLLNDIADVYVPFRLLHRRSHAAQFGPSSASRSSAKRRLGLVGMRLAIAAFATAGFVSLVVV